LSLSQADTRNETLEKERKVMMDKVDKAQNEVEASKRDATTSLAAVEKAEKAAEESSKKVKDLEAKLARAEAKLKIWEDSANE